MGFLSGRVTFTRYRVGGDVAASVRRRHPGAGPPAPDRPARLGRAGRRDRRRLGRRRPRARPDHRPGQERRQRRPAPGHPDRHRQDPRLAPAGLHPDRDRRPGAAQPQRRSRPRPSARRPRRPPRPAPRPRPPTAGSAATTITRSSGTARPRPSTPAPPARASSTGSRPCSARPSTGTLEPITAGSLARSLSLDGSDDPGRRVRDPRCRARSPWLGEPARSTSVGRLGRRRPHQPRLPGQRVPGLDLARAPERRRDASSSPTARRSPSCWPRRLTLDCPRGETGRDQLTDDAPTRLPEAFRALQAGKLPRKAGMILVRHGAQYELTLQAETLAVSGAGAAEARG